MKSYIIFLTVLLLTAITVHASCDIIEEVCDDIYYDKGHNSEEQFEDDGILYSSKVYSEDQAILFVDNEKYILEGECSCKRADSGKKWYCIEDIETVDEDIDDGKLDKIIYVKGDAKLYAQFVFCDAKPTLEVDFTVNNKKPQLDEVLEFTLKITNEGTKSASNINLNIPIPDGLSLIDAQDFVYNAKTKELHYDTASLLTAQELKFKLKTKNQDEYSIEPYFNYTYDGESLEIAINDIDIEVNAPYDIDITAPTSVSKKESFTLEIPIENTLDDQDIRITNLEIILPEQIGLYESSSYSVTRYVDKWNDYAANKDVALEPDENGKITYKGLVKKGDAYSLFLELEALKSGTYPIQIIYTVNAQTRSYQETKSKDIKISDYQLLSFDFDVSDDVESQEEFWIRLNAENKDKNNDFTNINIEITSELFNKITLQKSFIPKTVSVKLHDKFYKAPLVEEPKKYDVKLKATYKTPEQETITYEKTQQISVDPKGGNIAITLKPEKEEIEKEEEIEISVFVKNQGKTYASSVKGSSILDDKIEILAGKIAGSVSLKANEEKLLYKYRLRVPSDFEDEKLVIQTIVNSDVDTVQYYNKEQIELTILGNDVSYEDVQEEEVNVTDEIKEDTAVIEKENKEESSVEKQDGFLTRLWNSFLSIFGK